MSRPHPDTNPKYDMRHLPGISTILAAGLLLASCTRQPSTPVSMSTDPKLTIRQLRPLQITSVGSHRSVTIPASAPEAAMFVIEGVESRDVTIEIPSAIRIQDERGHLVVLSVDLDRAHIRANYTENQQRTVTVDASSGSASKTLGIDGDGDGLGRLYLWIGGTVRWDHGVSPVAGTGWFEIKSRYTW